MDSRKIVFSVFAEDRPGVIQAISDVVLEHKGNWLESSLSRLCGQFAGLVHVDVAQKHADALINALTELSANGIQITRQSSSSIVAEGGEINAVQVIVEANDRAGIIGEITAALSDAKVNIDSMETGCESASMAGYQLFKAHMLLALPEGMDDEQLEQILEDVSDDLMINFVEFAD